MRVIHLPILGILFFVYSCQQQADLALKASASKNELFLYQDTDCFFVIEGLNKAIELGQIDSMAFTMTASFSQGSYLYDLKDFKNDTMRFEFRGDLMVADSVTEIFTDKSKDYFFIGNLHLYSNNEVTEQVDTLLLSTINPLMNEHMEGLLKNNKREGRWLEYYDSEHSDLGRISFFVDGKRHGVDSVFKDGELYILSNWDMGQKNGNFQIYWPNGRVKWETLYIDGKQSSRTYIFNSAGELTDSLEIGN